MIRCWLAAVALALPAAAQEPYVPLFDEVTASAGIDHAFAGGWEQIVGGGVAVFDCNNDGRLDMVIAGGSAAAGLWRNDSDSGGPLRFGKRESGAEIAGVAGAYALDIDSDNIRDLVLLRVGENLVLRGQGDCRFSRANEDWGFDGGDGWSTAFAATWEGGSQWPTLAIGNYIDRREQVFPWGSCTDNWLHRPGAGSGFNAPVPLTPSYCALSMLFTDWNRSGTPSLRVSNDREYYKGGQEQMWTLQPGEAPRPLAEPDGWQRLRIWGMGIAAQDLNFDGYPEYFLTSMADSKLQTLAEVPPGAPPLAKFADIAFAKGVIAQRPYTGEDIRPSTGWHAQFEDVNNDGLADLFIAKGNVDAMPDFAEQDPNNLLLQRADGTFAEAGDRAGVASLATGRGAALADFNGDGRLDLVVVNRNAPVQVWQNLDAGPGNWLSLTLSQPAPNTDAIGSWVEMRLDGHLLSREITVGGGHGGGVLGPLHFGLGTATDAEVRVIWPDGEASDWFRIGTGQHWEFQRGKPPIAAGG